MLKRNLKSTTPSASTYRPADSKSDTNSTSYTPAHLDKTFEILNNFENIISDLSTIVSESNYLVHLCGFLVGSSESHIHCARRKASRNSKLLRAKRVAGTSVLFNAMETWAVASISTFINSRRNSFLRRIRFVHERNSLALL